jgi:hypothetical protein
MDPEVWRAYLAEHGMDYDEIQTMPDQPPEEDSEQEQEQESKAKPPNSTTVDPFFQREPSPIEERDAYRWAYQVFRKTWTRNETEDNVDWVLCGKNFFDSFQSANAAASQEAFKDREGEAAIGGQVTKYQFEVDEDNMVHLYFETQTGFVRIEVRRQLRTPEQRSLPQSKAGWLPRYAYSVLKRTTRKDTTTLETRDPVETSAGATDANDTDANATESSAQKLADEGNEDDEMADLFGSPALQPPQTKDIIVTNTVTTSTEIREELVASFLTALEHANYEAAMHTLDLVANPRSTDPESLAERNQARDMLLQKLEELKESGGMFSETIEDEESGSMKVEVWVRKDELRGPRNI